MAATNINRVVLTGNLTRDPELRSLRAACPSARCASPATPAARTTPPASGRTSRTTSTSPCGAPRARTAPGSSPRAARSRSTAGSSGASGRTQNGNKRQAIDIIADAVQFLGGRDDGPCGGGGGLHAPLRRPGRHQRLPARRRPVGQRRQRRRRRHPLLGGPRQCGGKGGPSLELRRAATPGAPGAVRAAPPTL